MSDNLIAVHGDERDNACTIRVKVIYEECFIRSLEGCRDQIMDSSQISGMFAPDDHHPGLSLPAIPDVGHPLLVPRTISKTDRLEASCFVKASCMLIRLETPQFECADPGDLCCID